MSAPSNFFCILALHANSLQQQEHFRYLLPSYPLFNNSANGSQFLNDIVHKVNPGMPSLHRWRLGLDDVGYAKLELLHWTGMPLMLPLPVSLI